MLLACAAPAPSPLELLQLDDELGFDDVLKHMQSRSPGGPLLGRSPGGAGHQTARSRGSSMRGAAARGEKHNGGSGTPGGVGDVAHEAAAERGEGSSTGGGAAQYKRSSTTGASAEWPHGLSKVVKEESDNSPRQQSSRGGGSGSGRARSHAAAEPRGSRSDRGGGKTKKGGRSPAVEEEEDDLEDFDEYAEDESGRPRSAPASHGGGSSRRAAPAASVGAGAVKGDRRLSFTAAATPAAKSEGGARPPRASLDPLTTPRHSLALGGLCGFVGAVYDEDGEESPGGGESKKCNCKKSKCLKLYCECFAAGAFCDQCSCQNCQNTPDNAVGTIQHCPPQANTARRVIDTRFEPSFLDLNDII